MQRFLKIVGNGQRTARSLTLEEAQNAIELVLSGQASPAQVGAFMAALRIKEESSEELAAFTQALRRHSLRLTTELNAHQPFLVDVCLPFDGRSKTPTLIPAAALIAAAAGAKVALHGRLGKRTPPKFGIGVGDVLAQLGIPVGLTLSEASELIQNDAVGLAYVDSSQFAPRLETFNQLRLDYGMRSFFNTIEKLINPFNAGIGIVGVFHEPVMQRVAAAMQAQGYERGIVVHGPEGSTDVLTSRRTALLEFGSPKNPAVTEWSIDPHQFGVWERAVESNSALTSESNAAFTLRLLDTRNTEKLIDLHRQSAFLTAALIVYAADKAPSFDQAFVVVQDALKDGLALHRLNALRELNPARVM